MAKVQVKMPEDFLLRLSKLGNQQDSISEKVLEAGGEVVLEEMRTKLSAVVGKNTKHPSRSTGELESSLGLSSVKLDKKGNHNIKVGFSEPRHDGEPNAKLANILEYGKHGQPAKPFLKPTKTASKAACVETMKRAFEEEVDKL